MNLRHFLVPLWPKKKQCWSVKNILTIQTMYFLHVNLIPRLSQTSVPPRDDDKSSGLTDERIERLGVSKPSGSTWLRWGFGVQ